MGPKAEQKSKNWNENVPLDRIQTNKARNSRGLVNFDNHWQFFVIVCGWIGSSNPAKDNNKKVPTNNEKQIINFETNFFDETSFSGFLGQK